ncbi:MAG: DUF5667 domain-containing protein [Chloroflexota bacterium]
MPRKPEDIFNECLDAILAGRTVEECLREHPDEAEELRPLLEMSAAMTRGIASIEPGPALKTSVMLRLDEALQERHKREQKRPFFYGWQPKFATAVAGVFVLLVVGIVSFNASARSQPDDLLYPLKLTTEQARLALTLSEPARTDLRLQLAETRVNELAYLAGKGDTAAIDGVVRTLESNLGVTPDQSVMTAAGGLLSAPAPAPRKPASEPSSVPAPAPAPMPMAEAAPPASSTTDTPGTAAKTETVNTPLAQSQSKSLAVLEEALKSAPDSAKPAIQQAILRVKRAYEQAISKAAK